MYSMNTTPPSDRNRPPYQNVLDYLDPAAFVPSHYKQTEPWLVNSIKNTMPTFIISVSIIPYFDHPLFRCSLDN